MKERFTKYSKCSLVAICIFQKTLAISVFSKVLAARKKNLSTARARKNKHTTRMLAKTIRYPLHAYGTVNLFSWFNYLPLQGLWGWSNQKLFSTSFKFEFPPIIADNQVKRPTFNQ